MEVARSSMPIPSTAQVTNLLLAWGNGDEVAFEQLVPVVHAELRRIARRQMGHERIGHTLQPTALVNEAYLKLIDIRQVQWQDRAHFFAMSSRVMRRVLVDCDRPGRAFLRAEACLSAPGFRRERPRLANSRLKGAATRRVSTNPVEPSRLDGRLRAKSKRPRAVRP